MTMFLGELVLKYPWLPLVLQVLGLLVVIAQVVVALTPSKKDDEYLAKLEGNSMVKKALDFFVSFAPVQKSSKGFELSNTSLGKKE